MSDLFAFILRFRRFFLFLILEAIGLLFVVQANRYHRVFAFHTANAVSGRVQAVRHEVRSYFGLRADNARLAEENARLREQVRTVHIQEVPYMAPDTIIDRPAIDTVVVDSGHTYRYLPGLVIDKTIYQPKNRFVVDRGTDDGVQAGMGVIGSRGIVGLVVDAGRDYASIMPMIHVQFRNSVLLQRTGFTGNIEWGGQHPDRMDLMNVPVHVDVRPGDTVVTSGYSRVFPRDLPVGTVVDFEEVPGSGFYRIVVEPFTEFQRISYVYFVQETPLP